MDNGARDSSPNCFALFNYRLINQDAWGSKHLHTMSQRSCLEWRLTGLEWAIIQSLVRIRFRKSLLRKKETLRGVERNQSSLHRWPCVPLSTRLQLQTGLCPTSHQGKASERKTKLDFGNLTDIQFGKLFDRASFEMPTELNNLRENISRQRFEE